MPYGLCEYVTLYMGCDLRMCYVGLCYVFVLVYVDDIRPQTPPNDEPSSKSGVYASVFVILNILWRKADRSNSRLRVTTRFMIPIYLMMPIYLMI